MLGTESWLFGHWLVTRYYLSCLGLLSVALSHEQIAVLWFGSYKVSSCLKDQIGSYTVCVWVWCVYSSDVVSMIHWLEIFIEFKRLWRVTEYALDINVHQFLLFLLLTLTVHFSQPLESLQHNILNFNTHCTVGLKMLIYLLISPALVIMAILVFSCLLMLSVRELLDASVDVWCLEGVLLSHIGFNMRANLS